MERRNVYAYTAVGVPIYPEFISVNTDGHGLEVIVRAKATDKGQGAWAGITLSLAEVERLSKSLNAFIKREG
jgi:hypothetical protein